MRSFGELYLLRTPNPAGKTEGEAQRGGDHYMDTPVTAFKI